MIEEHSPQARRLIALGLMAAGSTAISFGGLVIRNIEQADGWQLVFYRAIGMLISVSIILMLRYRRHTIFRIRDIGWPGVFGSLLVATASISFVQSVTHTTVANALFMLCAIPFISAASGKMKNSNWNQTKKRDNGNRDKTVLKAKCIRLCMNHIAQIIKCYRRP